MSTVVHKTFGLGEVIKKEVKEDDIYMTVRFGDGKEMRVSVQSFELGVVTAEGDLKEEIDAVISAKKAAEEARKNAVRAMYSVAAPAAASAAAPKRSGRKPNRKVTAKGAIQTQYEVYLEAAGYPVVGISGNDSTVPQYSRAVEKVVEREGLSWSQLVDDIVKIVKKYDKGGSEEDYGDRGNKTVINALKRFAEFVESTKSSD